MGKLKLKIKYRAESKFGNARKRRSNMVKSKEEECNKRRMKIEHVHEVVHEQVGGAQVLIWRP